MHQRNQIGTKWRHAMKRYLLSFAATGMLLLGSISSFASEVVTVDNFVRAETDMTLARYVKQGAWGNLAHSWAGAHRKAGRDPHESRHDLLCRCFRPHRAGDGREAGRRRSIPVDDGHQPGPRSSRRAWLRKSSHSIRRKLVRAT